MPFGRIKRGLSFKRKSRDSNTERETLVKDRSQDEVEGALGAFSQFSMTSQSGEIDLEVPGASDIQCVIDRQHLDRLYESRLALITDRFLKCSIDNVVKLFDFAQTFTESEHSLFHNFHVLSKQDYVAAIQNCQLRLKVVEHKFYVQLAGYRMLLAFMVSNFQFDSKRLAGLLDVAHSIRVRLNERKSKIAERISLLKSYDKLWDNGEHYCILQDVVVRKHFYDTLPLANREILTISTVDSGKLESDVDQRISLHTHRRGRTRRHSC